MKEIYKFLPRIKSYITLKIIWKKKNFGDFEVPEDLSIKLLTYL